MGVLRFILIVVVAYLLWRVIRLVFRMIQNPFREDDEVIQPPESRQSEETLYTDVKDAQYEDLPPPDEQDDKAAP